LAKKAADKLLEKGIENVLLTVGRNGAYLFNKGVEKHIPIPQLAESKVKDETGCGDQTTAALCAFLEKGKSVEKAAELAIRAGTIQFHRMGVQPVRKEDFVNEGD